MRIYWLKIRTHRMVFLLTLVFLLIFFYSDISSWGYVPDYRFIIVNGSHNHKPFIPDSPSKIPVMKPADIPRQFLIEEEDLCRRRNNLQVVTYVHSTISRVDQRMATRRTWANSSALGLNMAVVFMVGLAKDEKETQIIKDESRLYHDIVQGNYTDHYHLLSYKALSSLYWVTRHCAQVPWTLHADDDLLVDTFLLRRLIRDLDDESREKLTCSQLDAYVYRWGKWSVARKEFPALTYPPYCRGVLWLLATRLVPKLLKASEEVIFLWIDDVYITGLLPRKHNITINNIGEKYVDGYFRERDIGNAVVWYHLSGSQEERWKSIVRYHTTPPAKL